MWRIFWQGYELKTLAIASSKGGVGKTTLTIHMAVAAFDAGKSVVVVDTDPQGSAFAWWKIRGAEQPYMVQCRPGEVAEIKNRAKADGLDLIIIDSAPAHSDDVATGSELSDLILIPSRPSFLDLDAIGTTVKAVTGTKKPAAILFNACPPGRGIGEASVTYEARQALEGAPIKACEIAITQRAAFSHAFNGGQAVSEYEPNGKGAREINNLWKWVEGRLFNGS